MSEPIDIIMLTHDRLDHLVATVEALEARTPEPYRLTVVDNASGPETRNWLAENEERFAQVLRRERNEHVPAFQYGIAATTSDPFIVTDPDLVVPDLKPSWLARLRAQLERHPDFGLVGTGLEQSNRPPGLPDERVDPATVVDDDLVEGDVGTWFQLIRRDALCTPYRSDGETCAAVRRAGYRVGWTRDLRVAHLGWDDYKLHPAHLAGKNLPGIYPDYAELALVGRAPTLVELAVAGPVLSVTRELAVPDAAVLELTWSEPALAAAIPGLTAVRRPPIPLPFEPASAGAVVLVDPPSAYAEALIRAAARIATHAIVAVASLSTFTTRSADELGPRGWRGREAPAAADTVVAVARLADADPDLRGALGWDVLEHREDWLRVFAAAAFGRGERRLWIWEPRLTPAEAPRERVVLEPGKVVPWKPDTTPPARRRVGLLARTTLRAQQIRHRLR